MSNFLLLSLKIMDNLNLYNKYRPKKFNDIFGQTIIKKLLQQSLIDKTFVKAYIFYGVHGVGKTSIARIFANGINCENFKDVNCQKCKYCLEISNNVNNFDIIEIDGASNSGIDQCRELIKNADYLPLIMKYKIYIIDECHNLSTNAWNSLLKIIEEPPKHIIWIFITTKIEKIPLTIGSRCQKLNFDFLSFEESYSLIKFLLSSENKNISEEIINNIIYSSGGSAREILSTLNKLFTYKEENIDLNVYKSICNTINKEEISLFTKNLLKKDKFYIFEFLKNTKFNFKNLLLILEETIETLIELYFFFFHDPNIEIVYSKNINTEDLLKEKDNIPSLMAIIKKELNFFHSLNKADITNEKYILLRFKVLLIEWLNLKNNEFKSFLKINSKNMEKEDQKIYKDKVIEPTGLNKKPADKNSIFKFRTEFMSFNAKSINLSHPTQENKKDLYLDDSIKQVIKHLNKKLTETYIKKIQDYLDDKTKNPLVKSIFVNLHNPSLLVSENEGILIFKTKKESKIFNNKSSDSIISDFLFSLTNKEYIWYSITSNELKSYVLNLNND